MAFTHMRMRACVPKSMRSSIVGVVVVAVVAVVVAVVVAAVGIARRMLTCPL